MKHTILKTLKSIEKDYSVKIILACESGSRAWGFPSNDSDYDVRFIYVNKMDWYLSIDNKKDVIELPIDDELDINGWDLKKSLKLMKKSNSPLFEWLSSPIKYLVWKKPFEMLLEISKKAFLPETSCYHYLSMAKKKAETIEDSERVKLKTYMYAIRPTLCSDWIIRNLNQPPMQIKDILDDIRNDTRFKERVIDLIKIKKDHSEKYTVNRDEIIDTYIKKKIVDLHKRVPKNPRKLGSEIFDDVFKYIVKESEI
jgi:predicted nucleotidyltransferase